MVSADLVERAFSTLTASLTNYSSDKLAGYRGSCATIPFSSAASVARLSQFRGDLISYAINSLVYIKHHYQVFSIQIAITK